MSGATRTVAGTYQSCSRGRHGGGPSRGPTAEHDASYIAISDPCLASVSDAIAVGTGAIAAASNRRSHLSDHVAHPWTSLKSTRTNRTPPCRAPSRSSCGSTPSSRSTSNTCVYQPRSIPSHRPTAHRRDKASQRAARPHPPRPPPCARAENVPRPHSRTPLVLLSCASSPRPVQGIRLGCHQRAGSHR